FEVLAGGPLGRGFPAGPAARGRALLLALLLLVLGLLALGFLVVSGGVLDLRGRGGRGRPQARPRFAPALLGGQFGVFALFRGVFDRLAFGCDRAGAARQDGFGFGLFGFAAATAAAAPRG